MMEDSSLLSPPQDTEADVEGRAALGRVAAVVFVAAGAVSLLAAQLLSDPAPPAWSSLLALLALGSGALCLIVPWGRLAAGWLHLIPIVATLEAALSVWAAGETHGPVFSWLYLLIAVFVAAAFKSRTGVAAQLGLLSLASAAPVIYTVDSQQAIAEALVRVAILVVASSVVVLLRERLEARQQSFRELASRDPLTGVGNYRTLHERLRYEIARHERHGRSLTVLTLDLDDFKQVNERLGHLAGDRLLRRVARALSQTGRAEDTVSRHGGDEFSVLAPETGRSKAALLGERIQHALGKVDSGGSAVTASVGWAVYPEDGVTPERLLARADLALRQAKQGSQPGAGPAELSQEPDEGGPMRRALDPAAAAQPAPRPNGGPVSAELSETVSRPAMDRRRWHAAADAAESPGRDRRVMARALAYLFATTATVELLSLLVFDFPAQEKIRIVALSTGAYGVVLALAFSRKRLRPWMFHLVLACGTLLVTSSIHFSGQSPSVYTSFYLWIALYAVYFFARGQVAVHFAVIGLSYGVVLSLTEQDFPPLTNWLVTIGTLVLAGAVVALLQEQVEGLVRRLAHLTRTDPVTGLLNRRAFARLLELELERARDRDHPLTVVVGDLDHFKEVNARSGQHAGDRALELAGSVLDDGTRQTDAVARLGGGEFGLALPDTDADGAFVMVERLRSSLKARFADDVAPLTISFGVASYPLQGEGPGDLIQGAERALYAAKELGRDRSMVHTEDVASILTSAAGRRDGAGEINLATVITLAEALDVRDSGTARHSHMVGRYAQMTAEELGLPTPAVERLRLAGILHDLGKVGVVDSILRKPGGLTEQEMAEIRRHPEIGAQILSNANIDDIRSWVASHHERPDGSGYPSALAGEEIPLEARVLAVADAYEAMTVDRIYRPAIGTQAAREELRRCAGTQFDALVVAAFLRALDRERPPADTRPPARPPGSPDVPPAR